VVPEEAANQGLEVWSRYPKYLACLFFAGLEHSLGNVIAIADPFLAAMGRRHPIAGAVEQIASQEEGCGLRFGFPGDRIGR
jgi:hypothetical protein